jgi:DNA-binding NarL/FixJ family response regulator
MSVARVLVADPHAVVREGLKALLNARPDMRVVGEAADAATAAALAAELNPDVAVAEVSLPGPDGELARFCQAVAGRRVVILTADEDAARLRLALTAGARGYVPKRASLDRLVAAVRAVADGKTYLDPDAGGSVAGRTEDGTSLSEREAEVLRLVALGYCNKEIATRLRVSVKTVETYKARAVRKLGATSRVDVVRHALRRGWLAAD